MKERRIFIGILCLLMVILLAFMGNTQEPDLYGSSLLSWLLKQWSNPGSNAGHGWLIPLVSAYLVWRRRRELRGSPDAPRYIALVFIVPALLCYWAGCRAQQPRLGLLAMIALAWSMPLLLAGRRAARTLRFPCAYLVFALPMSFLTAATLPLRLIATSISAWLLNGLGVAVARRGTAIYSATQGFALDVADACSGLQSLLAMTALTAAYAYVTQKRALGKWALFLASVPLAMAGNVVRIVTIAIVARVAGVDTATRIYHDYSGYIVFAVAILLMVWLGSVLSRVPWPQRQLEAGGRAETPVENGVCVQTRAAALLSLLLAATLAAAQWAGQPGTVRDSALTGALPHTVGEWTGLDVLYCQNESCMAAFPVEAPQVLDACPRCGGTLDGATLGENCILPPDTDIAHKQYVHPAGARLSAAIVVTGDQRASIHRPQWCLPAQGFAITASHVMALPRPEQDGPALRVMQLELQRGNSPDRTRSPDAVFVYWFEARTRTTPYHWQRHLWAASDSVFRGVVQRWAYISVTGSGDLPQVARRFASELATALPRR